MLDESDLSTAVTILEAARTRAMATGALLVDVNGDPLTRASAGWAMLTSLDPRTFPAIGAASFAASQELGKLTSRVPLNEVRVGTGEDFVLMRLVSKRVILCVGYGLADTTHDMVALHMTRAGADLAPVLERYEQDEPGGEPPRHDPLRPRRRW